MRYLYVLFICIFSLSFAFAEDKETFIDGSKAGTGTTDNLNDLLLRSVLESQQDEQELKQKRYELLLNKYPDVVPRQQNLRSSSGLSTFVYDVNFVNTIFFSPGSSYLTNIQEEKLNNIFDTMLEEPSFYLVIVGHSAFNTQIDDLNKRLYYNRWISGRRAVQVWNYLVKKGIQETRLVAFAVDSQQVLNGEDTITQTNMNRRVELRLTNQPIPIGSGNSIITRQKKQRKKQNNNTNQN